MRIVVSWVRRAVRTCKDVLEVESYIREGVRSSVIWPLFVMEGGISNFEMEGRGMVWVYL